jgi:hypothetical protein
VARRNRRAPVDSRAPRTKGDSKEQQVEWTSDPTPLCCSHVKLTNEAHLAKSSQVDSSQVRSGQVRSGQANSTQLRAGQVRPTQLRTQTQVKSGQLRSDGPLESYSAGVPDTRLPCRGGGHMPPIPGLISCLGAEATHPPDPKHSLSTRSPGPNDRGTTPKRRGAPWFPKSTLKYEKYQY